MRDASSKLLLRFVVGVVGVSLCLSSGQAATINVPADQPTIQAGIDAAGVGDTVLVAPGTYRGAGNRDVNFNGKSITVRAASGALNTIINCEGTSAEERRGFVFETSETILSVLEGFTIENAYHNTVGGGVNIRSASPTIRKCIFFNNYGQQGGGISLYRSSARIENCTFAGNSSISGGGLFAHEASPRVSNCTFWGNTGNGQIAIENLSFPRINHSLIVQGNIRVEPERPEINIGPSSLILNCCIHFTKGRDGDRPVAGATDFLDIDPQLCDTSLPHYSVTSTSPCLSRNNDCGNFIGATDSLCLATDVDETGEELLPEEFSLFQNYPNPFNPSTTIKFSIPKRSDVTIQIYNVLGQEVAMLVNERLSAGEHSVSWNGLNYKGESAATGVYFYRLIAGQNQLTREMILIK